MLNLHDLLIKEVSKIPSGDVALCLSGGIDSSSILFALLELGRKVSAYSFTLDSNLQLGDSGISQLFKKLLDTSLNTKGYKSVVGYFYNLAKENDNTQLQLPLEFE